MNDTAISIESQFMEAAFQAVLDAERELSAAKADLDKATTLLTQAKNGAEKRLADAWLVVEKMMAENGEYEVVIPGEMHDYKIGYTKPRQSVKVVDIDALPEDLVKTEKKPKLREIGERLKDGWQTNAASFEKGESQLTWKVIKHGK